MALTRASCLPFFLSFLLFSPTIRHIIALEPLLESSSVKEELWLAISSLAGKLCRMEEKATKSDEIERLVQRLSKPILKTCRYAGANDEVQSKVLYF